jgi:hypothetical protein
MAVPRQFSRATLAALDRAPIMGVRAGAVHRFTGVWVVVVEGRVFVRSWNDRPTGWYRAFVAEPRGQIHFGDGVERMVRAVPVRSARLRAAVSEAYGVKYNTRASQKWVEGFALAGRVEHTLELKPR